jgi:LuxR family maltose regulon positive regulatory protein
VQAPAGFGKTSLLTQWYYQSAQNAYATVWLTLSATDNSPARLLAHCSEALLKYTTAKLPLSSSSAKPDLKHRLDAVLHMLDAVPNPLFIYLDNLQHLNGKTESALNDLIERSPASVRFITASRCVPQLHLARKRSQSNLLLLGSNELRFNKTETQAYIKTDPFLKTADVDSLLARTEGWPAGIILASHMLQTQLPSTRKSLDQLSGDHHVIADYFNEEVFSQLSNSQQNFLIFTSILDELTPNLCRELTGNDNPLRLLNDAENNGYFIESLDSNRSSYRYHYLFRQFLQRQLGDNGHTSTLYQRASKIVAAIKHYDAAINYALLGNDHSGAIELLEQHCVEMAFDGKFRLLQKYANQLPTAMLRSSPRLQLVLAWLATRNLRFEETRRLLDNVEKIFKQYRAEKSVTAATLTRLDYLYQHQLMMLAAAQDKAVSTEQYCQSLLDNFPDQQHPYLRGTVYTQLLYARKEQYKLKDVERLQAIAQGILTRSNYSFASIALQSSVGPSLFFVGRTAAARRALEQGLKAGISYGGAHSSLAALPALPLAEIAYEANEIDYASQLLENALPYADELCFVDQLMPGHLTQARIYEAQGDTSAAFNALEQGLCIATERKLERMRVAIAGETVKQLIQHGRLDQAGRYADEAGILPESHQLLSHSNCTSVNELRASIWVRLELSEDRTAEAINTAKNWRRFCTTKGAIRSLIQWNILLAQLYFINGDQRAAQRSLREAMTHATPARLLRSFIDEGTMIHTLIANVNAANVADTLHPTDAFSAQLLKIFEQHDGHCASENDPLQEEGLYGKLTSREREILSLVGSGMRNNEVALKLGMTEGSVKWYMQQIFDKMGTRRRLQAVERAKRFGLIV